MIDKELVVDANGKEFIKCECDCGNTWYLPKEQGECCVKCCQCGTKSCGGYQMDFRGRVYPIPVLLQPQGSDLAKGLLRFAEGKEVDANSIRWLQIHGANVFGFDKESYQRRIEWVLERHEIFKTYVDNPLENRGWTEADKPFQFLAWCYEYVDYLNNPSEFRTHIPIQLDGTCNGLQHYSALLRDPVGGAAVNLINTEKPSDIYGKVAERLTIYVWFNEIKRPC